MRRGCNLASEAVVPRLLSRACRPPAAGPSGLLKVQTMRWMRCCAWPLLVLCAFPSLISAQESKRAPLPAPALRTVVPGEFTIGGADDVQRLLVSGRSGDRDIDFSHKATYATSDAKVAEVSKAGIVRPRGNGSAEIRVSYVGRETVAKVTVKN